MHFKSLARLAIFLGRSLTYAQSAPCPISVEVSMRVPQDAPGANSTSWQVPPPGWVLGNWKVVKSSHPLYQDLQNMEVDLSPIFPQSEESIRQTNDLTSYQLAGNNELHLAYGHDTWGPQNDAVYVFDSPSGGLSYQLEILAWGYDTAGNGHKVTYENEAPAINAPRALTIESRVVSGPTGETVNDIYKKIDELGYELLVDLAGEMRDLVHDGRREGIPVVCDAIPDLVTRPM
ncbi:hypothetical protein K469DRAFT_690490 [Zopfia rhizophila CBS 207.26]|uniref:Uncharacterized protein n=1 Tax=Zopfia rhizophila CBS 207.26 TaxID=1314779 RepID=A0A6A6DX46_9PEZI|nr:hypothetical protein K469DRAFT_690490 [Zopfia rhizophila CBS 207.26]